MKDSILFTALLSAVAGALLLYLFNQYFEIKPKGNEQLVNATSDIKKELTNAKEPTKVAIDFMDESQRAIRVEYCKEAYANQLPSEKAEFSLSECLTSDEVIEKISNDDLSIAMRCKSKFPDVQDIGLFTDCLSGSIDLSKSNAESQKNNSMPTKLEDFCKNTTLVDARSKIYLVEIDTPGFRGDFYRGRLNSTCQWHGEGIYIYKNGSEFVGTYSNGNRISGTEYYPDGGVREGMRFINNQLHGMSKYYFPNGQVNQETYRNGTLTNNVVIQLSPQQVYANQQRSQQRALDNNRRNERIGNYARCLGTPGEDMASCGNAWQGYTPPAPKKKYKCDYDVFGNQITSTCREQ